MFLKEKRYVTIKCRIVAVVNKQSDLITKEYSSSLTVSTKDVLLLCIIYSEEKREAAAIYITNAFIQTRVEN